MFTSTNGLVRRTVVTEEYIELVPDRTPVAPARPVQPGPRTADYEVQMGDIVSYTSNGGRPGEYRVASTGWRNNVRRLHLKGYNRKTGFWVNADRCRFLRRGW